jgi:hypothetical protein
LDGFSSPLQETAVQSSSFLQVTANPSGARADRQIQNCIIAKTTENTPDSRSTSTVAVNGTAFFKPDGIATSCTSVYRVLTTITAASAKK